ncbi:hypothetical protein ACIQ1D_19095 [Lysinibacillus xylanilyticus]|uniref:hypothetical protein n=1 Tax=Lysinibacillus xylanilyticus TaxID=582475 RepID=UPI00380E7BE8
MQNFVKIQVKDIVFDRKQKIEGRVTYIDYKAKKVKVEVLVDFNTEERTRTTKLVICKMFDLIVLDKYPHKKFDKNRQFTLVKEFHNAFGHPVANKPTPIEAQRGLNRTIWSGEELVEFLHASSKDKEQFAKLYYAFLDGLNQAYKKSLATEYIQDDVERIVAQADALTDTSYFINGSFVELGVLPQPLFEIVQASNMSKLFTDENGNKYAQYREEDGKIKKSPEFFQPEEKLKEEVLRQAKLV